MSDGQYFIIQRPEAGSLSVARVREMYADALASGQVEPSAANPSEMALSLHEAGLITLRRAA